MKHDRVFGDVCAVVKFSIQYANVCYASLRADN